MRMGHRIAEPEQPSSRPIPVEASIHDREDARALGFLGGGYVDYAVLEPQRRELQADAIFHDARDMLGTPEDIDDVDFLARRQDLLQVIQIGHGALTQHGIDRRCHGDDPVAEALQRTGHAVAGARGVGGQADHGNDPGRLQELGNLLLRGVLEHEQAPRPDKLD